MSLDDSSVNKFNFLFLPFDVGIAHIARSLAIAENLQKYGHTVTMALPKRKRDFFEKNTSITLIDITPISLVDDFSASFIYKDAQKIVSFVHDEVAVIKKIKPDIIVTDFRFSTYISATLTHIPLYSIIGSGGLSYKTYTPNIGFPSLLHVLAQPILSSVVTSFKAEYLKTLDAVAQHFKLNQTIASIFDNTTFIVPEYQGYLPLLKKRTNVVYVNPISWGGFSTAQPKWMSSIKRDGKTIYLTFGGTGFDSNKLITLSEKLLEKGYRVIVSSSSIANPDDFPKNKNLYVERYLPGSEISKRVDLVVCHGGYGTLTDAVAAGTPCITIPFNPDQLLHSLRFSELGLGPCALQINVKHIMDIIQGNWAAFEKYGKAIPVDRIVALAQDVLNNKQKYPNKITELAPLFKEKNTDMSYIFNNTHE